MALTNYVALVGWIFITMRVVSTMEIRKAVLIAVLGSFLFLPLSTIEFPLFPDLTKTTAAAYGLFFAGLLSNAKARYPFKMGVHDLPVIIFCFLVPMATSLSNGLGLYDGLTGVLGRVLGFGLFFWTGRRYFGSPSSMRALTIAMIIGGLLYVPLILIEIRLSPILHYRLYGFMQHSFLQHIRYGRYRPMVFMPHGLVVALWMATVTTVAFWLWRSKEVEKIWNLPVGIIFCVFAASTVLCVSANGIVFMLLGIACYFVYSSNKSSRLLRWLIIFIPLYLYFRISNLISTTQLEAFMARFFDEERLGSFMIRIVQEDLFGAKALLRPLFGWGWMGRAWPVDPETGASLISMIDAAWIIAFSSSGLMGLTSQYLSFGLGPLLVLKASGRQQENKDAIHPYAIYAVILSLVITIFLLDSLINSALPPFILLCSGALVSYHKGSSKEAQLELVSIQNRSTASESI